MPTSPVDKRARSRARNRARRIRRMLTCLMRFRSGPPKPAPASSH